MEETVAAENSEKCRCQVTRKKVKGCVCEKDNTLSSGAGLDRDSRASTGLKEG